MLEPLASKNQERQCTCLDRIIRRELPSGYHFGTHLHHSLEMVACISGQVVVTIHGVEHIVSPGEYLLVFPNIPHSTDVPGGEPAVFLQGHCHADSLTNAVLPQQRTSLVRDLSISRRRAIQAQMNTRLWACLQGLQVELEGEGRHNEDMIRLKLAELSILLSRDLEEADGGHLQENAHLTRAIDYIDQHYMEKLLVQDVAEAAGVSARYLTKLFLEHFHMGVSVYITHVRISRAITYKQTDPVRPGPGGGVQQPAAFLQGVQGDHGHPAQKIFFHHRDPCRDTSGRVNCPPPIPLTAWGGGLVCFLACKPGPLGVSAPYDPRGGFMPLCPGKDGGRRGVVGVRGGS